MYGETSLILMPNPDHETFITWLKDAYAFEVKLVPELKAHAGQAAEHPEIQRKIQQHLTETEQHAAAVRGIIEQLGGEVSSIKTMIGQAAGAAMGMSTALADDTLVKNALAEFTMEHTEIASYLSLIAAAEHLRLPEVIPPLRRILQQEEMMAGWLREQIAPVTIYHLAHEAVAVH
jgi:ferritin-like metal-binding protein YciE